MNRRSFLFLVGAAATAPVLTSACSRGVQLGAWNSSDVLAVCDIDGEAFLVGCSAASTEAVVALSLAELGVENPSWVKLLGGRDEGVVLGWSNPNAPVAFAAVDTQRQDVRRSKLSVNTGDFTLADGAVSCIVPQRGGFSLQRYDVGSGSADAAESRIDIAIPVAVGRAGGQVVVLGNDAEGAAVMVAGAGGAQTASPVRVSPAGVPGDVVDVGGLTAVSVQRTSAEGETPAGEPAVVLVRGGEVADQLTLWQSPRLCASPRPGLLAVEDTRDGQRFVTVADVASRSLVREEKLPSDGPVRGLRAQDGRLWVLQRDGVTRLSADGAVEQTYELPGQVLNEW